MGQRGVKVCLSVLVVTAIAPATANAATFCVSDSACDSSGGMAQPTIQDAFNAAAAFPGLDRVEVGAGTFAQDTLTAGAGNAVELVGEGQGATTITRVSTNNSTTMLDLSDADSSVSDLTIRLNESIGGLTGLRLQGGQASRLAITDPSAATNTSHIGAVLDGSTPALRNSSVSVNAAGVAVRATTGTGTTTLDTVQLAGATGLESRGSLSAQRISVNARTSGIAHLSGTATLDQAVVRLSENGQAVSINASLSPNTAGSLVARHLTAVGSGNGTGAAATGTCSMGTGSASASMTIRNSIFRGFATDLRRTGQTGPPCSTSADLNVAYSIFDPSKLSQSGDGSATIGAGNQNVDPQFIGAAAGNLRLLQGSPAIDAGDPAAPAVGELNVDLDGRRRVQDGNNDGAAVRDIGAYEHTFAAPVTGDGGGDGSGGDGGNTGEGDGGGGDGGGEETVEIVRTLTLGYSEKSEKFKGTLRSNEAACLPGRVKVFEKVKGKDPKVGADRTGASGKWSFEEPGAGGRFYASVPARSVPAGTCPEAKSKTKQVG